MSRIDLINAITTTYGFNTLDDSKREKSLHGYGNDHSLAKLHFSNEYPPSLHALDFRHIPIAGRSDQEIADLFHAIIQIHAIVDYDGTRFYAHSISVEGDIDQNMIVFVRGSQEAPTISYDVNTQSIQSNYYFV